MAITPDIKAPQALAMAVIDRTTPDIRLGQAEAIVTYNLPSKNIRAGQMNGFVTFREQAADVRVSQVAVMAVVIGRAASPQVRAFTFTLDGHDFYCVRLGDKETLLYDVSTQEWVDWASDPLLFWRVNCSVNWVGAQSIGFIQGGTDIVAGDDTWGLLYFLDPTQPYDDFPDALANPDLQQVPFNRVIMAQTLVSGRNFIPCYAVFLSGDNYGITANNFTAAVQLEISDDQGKTFWDAGTITVEPDTYDTDYRWTSLGQVQNPGRLFRITDNGILTRIDSLEMNDD